MQSCSLVVSTQSCCIVTGTGRNTDDCNQCFRAGKRQALELSGDSRCVTYDDIPQLWSKAAGLTRLHIRDCNVETLGELQSLPVLENLTFSS